MRSSIVVRNRHRIAAWLTIALAPTAALSQQPRIELGTLEQALELGDLGVDLAVPESPAFVALGLDPEDVTRPASPREFATSLLSAVDKQGNFQVGVAIDTAPYVLARGVDFDLAEYRERPTKFSLTRFLARTQLSIATAKGTSSDDEAARVALGLRFNPWSKGDARLDDALLGCLLGVANVDLSGAEGPPGTGVTAIPEATEDESLEEHAARVAAVEAEMTETTDRCIEEAEARNANASGWDLGVAPSWIQEGGGNADLSWGGATFWSSLAFGGPQSDEGERRSQFILHTRFRLDESLADESATSGYREQDVLLVGGRARFGPPSLAFSIEAAYLHEDPEGGPSDSSLRGAISADVRLRRQLWLHLALGASGGREEDRIFIGGTIKWGGQSLEISDLVGKLKALE